MPMISLLRLNLPRPQGRRVVGGLHDEGEDGDVRSGMSLESVHYFPHNDSARIRFSCPPAPGEAGGAVPSHSRTRTVTCSFAEEQAQKVGMT